ncbi:hypothetical protein OEZ85_013591 [Tetradesmus obliquus]|uniref:SPX domain-containing protein n=1 Tax=Tetradesmus obliquus TaxID=3088 RepID=A0ABY8URU8_TETOB|nr:hypothetical protein OEZ85_013591 [Tetradesmus obliquus]
MPQKKAKKRGDNGVSLQLQKVGGYAYTKKFIELQALVRSLQAQAEAAKQQVEDSQQREMVLLDLTVHQEQILSLFHHQILRATMTAWCGACSSRSSSVVASYPFILLTGAIAALCFCAVPLTP